VFYLLTQFTTFFSSNGTYIRKRCTFKKLLKSHIFIFDSAPFQISVSLQQILCFTFSQTLKCFLVSKVHIKEIGALSKKYKITYFLCALSDFFIFASKFVLFLLTQFTICLSFQRYLSKK